MRKTARVMTFEHFGIQFFNEQLFLKSFFSDCQGPTKLYYKVKQVGALKSEVFSMKKTKFGWAEYLDTLHPLFKIPSENIWNDSLVFNISLIPKSLLIFPFRRIAFSLLPKQKK